MKKLFWLFFYLPILLSFGFQLFSVDSGSDSLISRKENVFFPQGDTDNRMRGFAAFEGGFTLENENTTCVFDSFFPVSGNVDLRGGTLKLEKDLTFNDITNIVSSGEFLGNNSHSIYFPSNIFDWKYSYSFSDLSLFFKSDLKLIDAFTFNGNCFVDMANKKLDVSEGQIFLASGSNLNLKNVFLYGLNNSTFVFGGENCKVSFANVTLQQTEDIIFNFGLFHVDGPCTSILYDYDMTFVSNASLIVDSVTLWKDEAGADDLGYIVGNVSLINNGAIKDFSTDVPFAVRAADPDELALIRDNSEAIVNTILPLLLDNSNSVSTFGENCDLICGLFNDLYTYTQYTIDNSNAVVDLDTRVDTVETLAEDNSDAIVVLDSCCDDVLSLVREDSEAIVGLDTRVDHIETLTRYILDNSEVVSSFGEITDLLSDNSETIAFHQSLLDSIDIPAVGDINIGGGKAFRDIVSSLGLPPYKVLRDFRDITLPADTAQYNIFLDENHKINVIGDATLDGSAHFVHFARTTEPLLVFDGDYLLTVSDIVFKDFSPYHILHTADSTLIFGEKTFLELTDMHFADTIMSLSIPWVFDGLCGIHGYGNILDVSEGGIFDLWSGTTLYLTDITLLGVNNLTFSFEDDLCSLHLNDVHMQLDENTTFTLGNIYVDGPSTIITHDKILTFNQDSILTVSAVTLWKDEAGASGGNIVGIFDLVHNGTIKLMVEGELVKDNSEAIIAIDFSEATNLARDNSESIVDLRNDLDSIDHGPGDIYYSSNITMTYNIYLGTQHKMYIQDDMVLNGSNYYIHFSRADEDLFYIDAGKTVTLQNIVLKDFSPDYVSFGDANSNLIFGEDVTIEMFDDISLGVSWTFTGNARIKGYGNRLEFENYGAIDVIGPHLIVEDLILVGVAVEAENFRCRSNDCTITLKNSALILDGDYTFSYGALIFEDEVHIVGILRTFGYSSEMTSTINEKSTLFIDNDVTFSYVPTVADRDLIEMIDHTSMLHLNGCSLYSSSTGIRFTYGTVLFDNFVTLSANGQIQPEGIAFGDSSQDAFNGYLNVEFLSGSRVEVYGYVDFK